MSFPYALLHFEARQAKQRLTQVFHAGPGLRSDSLYPVPFKSEVRLASGPPPRNNRHQGQKAPFLSC
jgi:hypothetical protein